MLIGIGFEQITRHAGVRNGEFQMTAIRILLAAAASTIALIPAAEAQTQYQSQADCESSRQGRQVAGAIFGAILGGVIGAEIEDEIDDRDNYRGRGHGRYRGHRGRGGRHHRPNVRHENDAAVLAGAGVGALIGAGVAGGDPCAPDNRNYDAGYYGNDYGYQGPYNDKGGSNAAYSNEVYYDGQYYDDGYSNNTGYGTTIEYGDDGLAGAPAGRVYQAGTPQTGNCRWMTTRSQNQYGTVTANDVYMCQGADNIWRPAQ